MASGPMRRVLPVPGAVWGVVMRAVAGMMLGAALLTACRGPRVPGDESCELGTEVEGGHHMRCHIPLEELRLLQGKERATA